MCDRGNVTIEKSQVPYSFLTPITVAHQSPTNYPISGGLHRLHRPSAVRDMGRPRVSRRSEHSGPVGGESGMVSISDTRRGALWFGPANRPTRGETRSRWEPRTWWWRRHGPLTMTFLTPRPLLIEITGIRAPTDHKPHPNPLPPHPLIYSCLPTGSLSFLRYLVYPVYFLSPFPYSSLPYSPESLINRSTRDHLT